MVSPPLRGEARRVRRAGCGGRQTARRGPAFRFAAASPPHQRRVLTRTRRLRPEGRGRDGETGAPRRQPEPVPRRDGRRRRGPAGRSPSGRAGRADRGADRRRRSCRRTRRHGHDPGRRRPGAPAPGRRRGRSAASTWGLSWFRRVQRGEAGKYSGIRLPAQLKCRRQARRALPDRPGGGLEQPGERLGTAGVEGVDGDAQARQILLDERRRAAVQAVLPLNVETPRSCPRVYSVARSHPTPRAPIAPAAPT